MNTELTPLQQATQIFIDTVKDESADDSQMNAAVDNVYKFIHNASEEEVAEAMKSIFQLIHLPDIERASMMAHICGYLVECGYPAFPITDDFIAFYRDLLNTAIPFYERFFEKIADLDEDDEERDEKVNQVFEDLKENSIDSNPDEFISIIKLDNFFPCGVSIFSADREAFSKGKKALGEKVAYIDGYNDGCYWINLLFTVLFDEKVVVIDIDTNKGFEGTMSGVVDNFQLQMLLMGLPELNDEVLISEEDIAVVNGEGAQTNNNLIAGKWNMYDYSLVERNNWKELVNNQALVSEKTNEYSDTWIWSEGIPADIPVYRGKRVILLGKAAYQRNISVQRTYKNLKATIRIDKILSEKEIEEWLG